MHPKRRWSLLASFYNRWQGTRKGIGVDQHSESGRNETRASVHCTTVWFNLRKKEKTLVSVTRQVWSVCRSKFCLQIEPGVRWRSSNWIKQRQFDPCEQLQTLKCPRAYFWVKKGRKKEREKNYIKPYNSFFFVFVFSEKIIQTIFFPSY
jgi:hypothetical protein